MILFQSMLHEHQQKRPTRLQGLTLRPLQQHNRWISKPTIPKEVGAAGSGETLVAARPAGPNMWDLLNEGGRRMSCSRLLEFPDAGHEFV